MVIVILYFPNKVLGTNNTSEFSGLLKENLSISKEDSRITILKKFLEKHNSPLSIHAKFIVDVSDAYRIPWYFVPAISGVESTFCKNIPYNSFNCWGWNNGKTYFKDFEDAIYNVTKGLKYGYFDKDMIDAYTIGPVYAPPSKTWANKVMNFCDQIQSFKISSSNPDFSL